MKLLLDTSVLIALRKGDRKVQRVLNDRKDHVEEVGMSRLTEYELRLGGEFLWKKYGDARELAWLEDILDWLTVYEIDKEVVRDASDVQAEALGKGNPFPDIDLLISLSAKSGSELLTFDENQFRMREILVEKGVKVFRP